MYIFNFFIEITAFIKGMNISWNISALLLRQINDEHFTVNYCIILCLLSSKISSLMKNKITFLEIKTFEMNAFQKEENEPSIDTDCFPTKRTS